MTDPVSQAGFFCLQGVKPGKGSGLAFCLMARILFVVTQGNKQDLTPLSTPLSRSPDPCWLMIQRISTPHLAPQFLHSEAVNNLAS